MGAHLVLHKPNATRQDFEFLLDAAPLCGMRCLVKETCHADFMRMFGLSEFAAESGPSPSEFVRVPDDWLDLNGDIVLRSMSYSAIQATETALGVTFPTLEDAGYDEKRSTGRVLRPRTRSRRSFASSSTGWMRPSDIPAVSNGCLPPDSDADVQALIESLSAAFAREFCFKVLL